MGALMAPSLLSPVAAFKLIDHAMCKEIDWDTLTCKQRASQFNETDEWAYLWFRVVFETSDVGKQIEFNFYDPDGSVFAKAPSYGPVIIAMPGESLGWMGVGIKNGIIEGAFGSSSSDPRSVQKAVQAWRDMVLSGNISKTAFPKPFPINMLWAQRSKPASEKAGEWRAEFTLGGNVIISERFRIDTGLMPYGLLVRLLLVGGVAAIVAVVGVYMYMRRKKPASAAEPATGEVSPSPTAGTEGFG